MTAPLQKQDVIVGTVVFDATWELPVSIRDQDGGWVIVSRPGGRERRVPLKTLRHATDAQRRQYACLEKFLRCPPARRTRT